MKKSVQQLIEKNEAFYVYGFSDKLQIFKAFRDVSGIIGYNKKLIFLTISKVV